MNWSLLIFPFLLPLSFWAAYHYYHDRNRPEPVVNLALSLGLGVVAALIGQGLYQALGTVGLRYDAVELADSNLPGLLAYSILGIGLIEESAKMLPFLLFVLRFRDFDEPLDGIVYASFLALGYAVVENVHYLQYVEPVEAVARGFAGPLVHIAFASVWAYHVGRARLDGTSVASAAVAWLALSAVLHGIYDFIMLGFPGPAQVSAAAVVVAVWLWRLRIVRRLGGGVG